MVSVAVLSTPSTSDITRWCDFAQLPSQSIKFLKYKKGHSGVYPGDLVTRTGDREIHSAYGTLPDNPGRLA